MKIAHIGNTAGVGSVLANGQRIRGDKPTVFVFDDITKQLFGCDYYYNPNSYFDMFRLFAKLRDFNVLHYHYPNGNLKKHIEKRLKRGQVYLKHYHGDDLRGQYEPDLCIVSTPDLLRFAPNGIWIPDPIDLERINKLKMQDEYTYKNRVPRIAHYPYYKYQSKHVDYFSEPLNQLVREGKCEIVTIADMPYDDAIRALLNCDIVIGKIIPEMGWFSKFELEGMAMGKPVIAYVSDELYSKYQPPVYRTTERTLKSDLDLLLSSDQERTELSKKGVDYVKMHDIMNVLPLFYKYYQNAVGS